MIREIVKKHTATAIGKRMNESVATICNWVNRGVPVDKALDFCRSVNFDVTPHQLYSKNYPHPHDGLPSEMRCTCDERAA